MDENTPPTNGQCVIKTEQPLVAATPVFSSGLDDIKHEVMASGSSFEHGIAVTPSPLCFSRAPLRAAAIQAGHEGMLALEESLDDEMDGTTSAPEEPDLHISAPSSAEAAAAAARASTLLLHQRMDAMVAGSPLYRRSISSPQPSSTPHNTALLHTPVVPSQQHHHKPAISPAATFNKVSVVHAKDTPGKVDKFEWRIRSKATMASPRTDLLACGDDADSSSASSAADSLPPRYFRAVTGSPTKRRVHSTTFGAFARSFSFNTSE
ncbi:TPA: hypothetical protein N0F65_006356 [Lagenidium giganteum]|uniref:Uncharacterized protein n=1 Tax=Lagenidium giganteum TaxID=4803 RepID=A0AAV2YCK1_9STRA|nr:TPA: hypothetical protein N0F65_006356 [Lagenidium giganteum]